MDIMRPQLVRIQSMSFRRLDLPFDHSNGDNHYHNNKQNNENKNQNNAESSDKIDDQNEVISDETNYDENEKKSPQGCHQTQQLVDTDEEEVEEMCGESGLRFKIMIQIAKRFHGAIIGKHGSTKLTIQTNSKTRIEVPKETDLTNPVVITGSTKEGVKSARNEINSIIESIRRRADFTHFVSIPFIDDCIRERFVHFKKQVLSDNECKARGIDDSLFQFSNKLHLTIAPLLLCDEIERQLATEVLEECDRNFFKDVFKDQLIKVKVEGIDYMNDDPTQVHVIYAKVIDSSDNNCLKTIINDIYNRFENTKLMTRSHEFERVSNNWKVKPHITLMNTKFRPSKTDSSYDRHRDRNRDRNEPNRRSNDRQAFDATPIMDKFKDFVFGEVVIQTIEISIRFSSGGKNGYYSHTHRIEI